jgi:L,D-peptidoglycan transpeptidase YkuD (ErfK/YbiS/YcfS/YnhG family)
MFYRLLRQVAIAVCLCVMSNAHAAGVPDDCTQLLMGVAPDWNSMHGELRLFERERGGPWAQNGSAIPVLFGKNGLAWGTGVAGQNESGLHKKEKDGRAPAGVFRIGKVYTYDAQLPPGSDYPFRTVTDADLWSDDPRSPDYNRHVVIDPRNPPDNYSHERMRSADFAYHWLIEIRHNSDPPVPGAGSAIFFHIRRGVNRATAGCTTMAESELVRVVRWLRAPRKPCYALLPASEYEAKWKTWELPAPASGGAKRTDAAE